MIRIAIWIQEQKAQCMLSTLQWTEERKRTVNIRQAGCSSLTSSKLAYQTTAHCTESTRRQETFSVSLSQWQWLNDTACRTVLQNHHKESIKLRNSAKTPTYKELVQYYIHKMQWVQHTFQSSSTRLDYEQSKKILKAWNNSGKDKVIAKQFK